MASSDFDNEEDNQIDIDIVIKTISNNIFNFRIRNDTTIERFKSLIQSATEVESDRQRLIYRGKVLLNETKIKDHNIESGHTVHMVAKPVAQNSATTHSSESSSSQSINMRQTPITTLVERSVTSSNASTSDSTNRNVSTNSSMEHVRQGLLSIHTVLSTIDASAFSQQSFDREVDFEDSMGKGAVSEGLSAEGVHEGDHDGSHKFDSDGERIFPQFNNSTSQTQAATAEGGMFASSDGRKKFFRGQWVDVKDTVSQWLEATVMDIDYNCGRVFIHYNGW